MAKHRQAGNKLEPTVEPAKVVEPAPTPTKPADPPPTKAPARVRITAIASCALGCGTRKAGDQIAIIGWTGDESFEGLLARFAAPSQPRQQPRDRLIVVDGELAEVLNALRNPGLVRFEPA